MKHTSKADNSREPDEPWFSWRFVAEILKVILISLAIILPIRYFLIQPFYVKGASMEPTFHDHEYLLIDEISYRFREPARGDIVVFRYPNDPSQYFIKRVVGLPEERILIRNGQVFIASSVSEEPVVLDESAYMTEKTEGVISVQLGPDEYYLLGDNRSASLDSRSFGPVQRRFIVGRTWIRAWPVRVWETFVAPSYNIP